MLCLFICNLGFQQPIMRFTSPSILFLFLVTDTRNFVNLFLKMKYSWIDPLPLSYPRRFLVWMEGMPMFLGFNTSLWKTANIGLDSLILIKTLHLARDPAVARVVTLLSRVESSFLPSSLLPSWIKPNCQHTCMHVCINYISYVIYIYIYFNWKYSFTCQFW